MGCDRVLMGVGFRDLLDFVFVGVMINAKAVVIGGRWDPASVESGVDVVG